MQRQIFSLMSQRKNKKTNVYKEENEAFLKAKSWEEGIHVLDTLVFEIELVKIER